MGNVRCPLQPPLTIRQITDWSEHRASRRHNKALKFADRLFEPRQLARHAPEFRRLAPMPDSCTTGRLRRLLAPRVERRKPIPTPFPQELRPRVRSRQPYRRHAFDSAKPGARPSRTSVNAIRKKSECASLDAVYNKFVEFFLRCTVRARNSSVVSFSRTESCSSFSSAKSS